MSETPTDPADVHTVTDRVELTKDERAQRLLTGIRERDDDAAALRFINGWMQALTAERDRLRVQLEQVDAKGGIADLFGERDMWRKTAERYEAELAAANARCAELEQWHAKCDEVGVPHDPDGLVRHHRNNEAATQGAWKHTAQLAIEQNAALQATLDRVTALADEWEAQHNSLVFDTKSAANKVRAALTPEGKP